jgi:hypothetical protein
LVRCAEGIGAQRDLAKGENGLSIGREGELVASQGIPRARVQVNTPRRRTIAQVVGDYLLIVERGVLDVWPAARYEINTTAVGRGGEIVCQLTAQRLS